MSMVRNLFSKIFEFLRSIKKYFFLKKKLRSCLLFFFKKKGIKDKYELIYSNSN
jgi:hypothetical protein